MSQTATVVGPTYEVLALRYATHKGRTAGENFLRPDDHAAAMPIDYYLWAVRSTMGAKPSVIVVDTGMGPDALARRPGRTLLTPVADALSGAGIDAATVEDVVITHMHYDHAGRLDVFPRATFHIQDAEMAFCTGRAMCHEVLRSPIDADDVVAAVRYVHSGRMRFHDGAAEIAPGVTLHLIGGHTGGLQAVRVPTQRGWVVLASDATHLWANIRTRNPFPIVADVTRMMEGYRILESLADGPDHIIPGHDPLVRTRFPCLPDQPDIVRLDLPPKS
ncbi:MAG TPA: N-acyl homoserine lactonase family protein [Acidimicrobiales bacterium]